MAPRGLRGARVLCVDADEAVRSRLSSLLEKAGYIATTAAGMQRAEDLVREQSFDLLITGLRFADQGYSGFDVIEHVRSRLPKCPMIMLTAHASLKTAMRAVRAHLDDYIQKSISDEELLGAVERVLTFGNKALIHFDYKAARWFGLSRRELEVLQLLYRGYSYDEIADFYGFTVATAKTYGKRIYKKLQVKSRAEAVYEAIQMNLIKP